VQVDYTAIGQDDYGNIILPASSVDGMPAQIVNNLATAFLQRASDALSGALAPARTAPAANGTVPQPSNMQRLVAIGALILGGVLLYKALAK